MGKKQMSILALATALVLGSCSSSDDLKGSDTGKNGVNISYLTVNINNVGAAPIGGRASSDYDAGGNRYEDGVGIENAINTVRFYFFNADGTPYILNNAGTDGNINYIDKVIEKNGSDHDHTAETVTKAVLILNGTSNLAPASMLAVVNPEIAGESSGTAGDLLGNGAQRFSVLRTSMDGSNWMNNQGFVMSNSVYKEAGVDVCSTQLSGQLYTNETDANSHPIDVYVERVLAKVTAKVDESNGNWEKVTTGQYAGTWKTKVGTLELTQGAGNKESHDIYAWIQGWGLADEDGKAELCKQIKVADWTDQILGIKPWSSSDYHRCFWSNSCPINNENPAVNHPFSSYTQKMGDALYTMPNTPDAVVVNPNTGSNHLTKLIVAAKLGYQDEAGNWKPAELCEYKGTEFLGISNLKTVLAEENYQYCTKTQDASGNDVYKSVTPDVFEFTTTTDNELKDYQVVAKLKDNTPDLYRVSDEDMVSSNAATYIQVSKAEINAELAKEPIEVRMDGDTYYYTPIKHLGTAGTLGEYGVVRNHSYQVTINSIKGWGTPVYDPSKVIVPTIPSNEKSYLAAKVNVLSWRVVNSKVDLDQTTK